MKVIDMWRLMSPMKRLDALCTMQKNKLLQIKHELLKTLFVGKDLKIL